MRLNTALAISGAAALAMPAMPVQGDDGSITIASCGDLPPVTIEIPGKRKKDRKGHDCCKRACHAATDRKKKGESDGCC